MTTKQNINQHMGNKQSSARKWGKAFEADFRKSCPDDILMQRLYDGKWRNPADYYLHDGENLIYLELKTTQHKRLDRANVRDHQLYSLNELNKRKRIKGGFVVNMRAVDETYYIDGETAYRLFEEEGLKSIPLEYFRKNCVRVGQVKKRTRSAYNYSFLKKI